MQEPGLLTKLSDVNSGYELWIFTNISGRTILTPLPGQPGWDPGSAQPPAPLDWGAHRENPQNTTLKKTLSKLTQIIIFAKCDLLPKYCSYC